MTDQAAWALAAAISPRPTVRVADVDDDGHPLNRYTNTAPLRGPDPGRPYAVHLADTRGRYTLLGFDLDTRHGPVAADLARLHGLLEQARIPHLTCASGPGGGRHVWVALAEPVTAAVIAGIAQGLAGMLPSLDTSPLLNPRTGALRPPGAPHRTAGVSRVIAGTVKDLLNPTVRASAVLVLAGLVDQHRQRATADKGRARVVVTDEHGHPHLTGDRRLLPARAQAALTTTLTSGQDASAVLAAVLCGAARARWRLTDIAAHLATAPGLEHARSERTGQIRTPRPPDTQLRILTHNWRRCVAHVASTHGDTEAAADDPTWEPRCAVAVAVVAAAQRRADASPGRWAQGGGPADRRVLDVLCEQVLAAVRADIELDIRRLANLAGIGRDTARLALHRLAADGWITNTQAAHGIHAAHWALRKPDNEPSTPSLTITRSQAAPRPGAPSHLRAAWRSHLHARTTAVAHDVFTPAGLGHHTARVHQALTTQGAQLPDISAALGYSAGRTRSYLYQLTRAGLARPTPGGRWSRVTPDQRDHAAQLLGCTGVLAERRCSYQVEREAWHWWLDELTWRRATRAQQRRTPVAGQQVLPLPGLLPSRHHRGPHPTHTNGRADYRAALNYLRETTTTESERLAS